MTDDGRRTFVILGDFEHEGLTSAADAGGIDIWNRELLRVTQKTWLKRAAVIEQLRTTDTLAGTAIYLHTTLLLKASAEPFRSAFFEIVRSVDSSPGFIFAFQDNLDGIFAKRHPDTKEPMSLAELRRHSFDLRVAALRKEAEHDDAVASNLTDAAERWAEGHEEPIRQPREEPVRRYPIAGRMVGRPTARSAEDLEQQAAELMRRAERKRQLAAAAEDNGNVMLPPSGDWRLTKAIERLEYYESHKAEVDRFIDEMHVSGMELAPFTTRSDVTIRLQQVLTDIDEGVFLRLFVLDSRVESDHLQGLLAVLERYLREVEGRPFLIDTRRSELGVTYLFRSREGAMDTEALYSALARFDGFMRLCGDDPAAAAARLKELGLDRMRAVEVAERLARDYRRIILDLRHEHERQVLTLKHRTESDMLNLGQQAATTSIGAPSPTAPGTGSQVLNLVLNSGFISMGDQQGAVVDGRQEVTYNQHDQRIIDLLEKHASPIERLGRQSDLDQLKDDSIPESDRRNARQRLVAFIKKAAAKAGPVAEEVATSALTKYLESLFYLPLK